MASTQTPNQSVKLTKRAVAQIAPPASGQLLVRDAILKGFGLRITANGVRAFFVEKRIDGKVKRLTLGRFGELTSEQARKEAQKLLGKIALGMNPLAEREHARLKGVTLEQAFEDFRAARKGLKERTLYDYRRLLKNAFEDWQKRPLVAITKDQVVKRHTELGKESGEAYANLAMRFLRSIFNFAIPQYEDGFGRPLLTENPVMRLTQTRAWYRSERRQTVIKVHQLAAWYEAAEALRSDKSAFGGTVADYLLTLLFTGLRRQEAAQLTWDQIDLKDKTLIIPDPKNRQPFLLPFSDYVAGIFERRRKAAEEDEEAEAKYVFPGEGPKRYLIEPKKYVARVIEASSVSFMIHDLRRTFITVAESIDIPPYAIKRMVNHKMRGDVTAGYIVADVERLRDPVQRVTDFLLKACKQKASAQIVELRAVPPAA
jgi:integrase